jgi:hypothetical protein
MLLAFSYIVSQMVTFAPNLQPYSCKMGSA